VLHRYEARNIVLVLVAAGRRNVVMMFRDDRITALPRCLIVVPVRCTEIGVVLPEYLQCTIAPAVGPRRNKRTNVFLAGGRLLPFA